MLLTLGWLLGGWPWVAVEPSRTHLTLPSVSMQSHIFHPCFAAPQAQATREREKVRSDQVVLAKEIKKLRAELKAATEVRVGPRDCPGAALDPGNYMQT